MIKKKLRDCTFGEVKAICENHKCGDCPLGYEVYGYFDCKIDDYPRHVDEDDLEDIEIDIPEEEE